VRYGEVDRVPANKQSMLGAALVEKSMNNRDSINTVLFIFS
jgi:hypothetical protein